MKVDIRNLNNQSIGPIELDISVFGVSLRKDLIARVIRWQLAERHRGTHKTKTISEISGTTKKPYRQKGTGNARQGSLRSAQMRGGSTVFGPVVRSHAHKIPKKVRRLALKSILSYKLASEKILFLDSLAVDTLKTRDVLPKLQELGLKDALIIDGMDSHHNFKKASSNIKGIDFLPSQGANVYDIVRHDMLVLTKQALEELERRLK